MNLRIIYNYVLVRLGIRHILPSYYIRKAKVKECNEPIIKLSKDTLILSYDGKELFGRNSVVVKLERISKILSKQGLILLIYELYRDANTQEQMRQEQIQLLNNSYPELSYYEIKNIVDKRVSTFGSGHQTGGAVDLTICKQDGAPLDMGTNYLEFNKNTETHSKFLTQEQINNRQLLMHLMTEEGFVNYPAEWWHFSYGDKMWAAYSYTKYAFYDIIPQKIIK